MPLLLPSVYELTYVVTQYSMYGHVAKLALAEKKGIEEAGGTADLYQYVILNSPANSTHS